MEKAKPVLLEPVVKMKITIPEEYMGDVMGDLNKRRGRVLGMDHNEAGEQLFICRSSWSWNIKIFYRFKSLYLRKWNKKN